MNWLLQDCADHDHDKRWIFEFNDDIDVLQHKGLVADDGDDAWKLTMVMTIDDGDDNWRWWWRLTMVMTFDDGDDDWRLWWRLTMVMTIDDGDDD